MKLVRRTNRAFPTFWDDFFDNRWANHTTPAFNGMHLPAVNIREDDEGYTLELAVPGMDKEDFKIDLDHDLLSISSEEKSTSEDQDKDGKYTRKEFSYRSFKRTFTLPETVDREAIKASYKDGVLFINIPKKEEAKPKPVKMIEIA